MSLALNFVLLYFWVVANAYIYPSDPTHELHVRRRASRPHKSIIVEPYLQRNTFFCSWIAKSRSDLQLQRCVHVTEGWGDQGLRYDVLTLQTLIQTFMQGMVDHEGNLSGRFHQSWSPNLASKIQLQVNFSYI